jgi:hypothetical protein
VRLRPIGYRSLMCAVLCAGGLLLAGAKDADKADDFLIVDCLLPAQIRQLGLNMTFLAPRQAIRTSAHECALRGGEFSAGDAGGPAGLKMWLPAAEKGDPQAQTYVGEIFERGLAGQPDYAAAIVWYRRAVDQGFFKAAINLGSLLEQGLGAPRDPIAAAKLFRRAAGLPEDMPLGQGSSDKRVQELTSQLAAANATNAANQAKIDQQSKQLNQLQRRLDERQSGLKRDQDALVVLQNRLAAAQQKAPADNPDAQKQGQVLAARERELQASKDQVDQLRAKLDKVQAADPAELDRMRKDLDGARSTVAAQQQEADRLKAALKATQEQDAARAAEQQAKLQGALATREHDLQASNDQVADLRGKLDKARLNVDATEYDRVAKNLDAARSTMAAQQQEADRLRAEMNKNTADAAARDQQQQQAQRQALAEREHALEASEDQVAQLRTRVAALEKAPPKPTIDPAEVEKMRTDLDGARSQMIARQQETDRLKTELASTESGGAAREKALRENVAELQKEIKDRQAGIAAKDSEIERLKSQVAQLDTTRGTSTGEPVATAAPTGLPLPIEDFGHYHALVIGINNYQHMKPLKTPISDAKEIAQVLQDEYGYDVTTLLDANRYQILEALNHLRQKLTDKDNLLIYYAGHGELDQVNQRGNWLPIDAEIDSTANWISNIQITDILNAMGARQILVVADSCYSGTLTRSVTAVLTRAQSETERAQWYKIMISKPSRVALTSGGLEPVADSGSGGSHSMFADLLIKTLHGNSSVLSAQEVYARIQPSVSTKTAEAQRQQVPEYAPIKMAGHEAGDFMFVKHLVR